MSQFGAEKFTTRSREAIETAQLAATTAGNTQTEPIHLLAALLRDADGTARQLVTKAGADAAALAARAEGALLALPKASGATVQQPAASPALTRVLAGALDLAASMKDDYVATEHLLVSLATVESAARTLLTDAGLTADGLREGLTALRGNRRVTSPEAESTYESLEKYSVDLTQAAEDGKLDPVIGRDSRDPPGDPGAVASYQEQPRADRRPRRRQDRRRRGPGPADRRRRRARLAQGSAPAEPRPGRDGGRREVPRRVRGAAQGRAGGDQGLRRPGDHLHRRAAHRRRRRCRRRLRDGRRQHAQADARPRRAADDRRDHARRVPRADREGPRARAPLPAGLRRRAVGRGHDPDPARHPGEVRGAPRRPDHRRRAGRGRHPERPLHHRPPAARQGDRPDRRVGVAAADGDRVVAGGDRPAPPHRRPPQDGGVRARQGDRRRVGGAAGQAARRPGRPRGAAARARGAVGAREGLAGGRGRDPSCPRPAADRGGQAAPRGQPRGRVEDPLRVDPRAGEEARRRRDRRGAATSSRWSARRSAPSRSPRWSRPGPASRPASSCRARPPSCSRWRT